MANFHDAYSHKAIKVNYGLVDLSAGLAKDTSMKITFNTPEIFAAVPDKDGNQAVSLRSDNSAIITFTFFASSANCKTLTNLYTSLKRTAASDDPKFLYAPLTITDPSGVVFAECPQAALMSKGELSIGDDIGTVDFDFYVADIYQIAVNSNIANPVTKILSSAGIDTTGLVNVTAAGSVVNTTTA